MRRARHSFLLSALVALALSGCDGAPATSPDAGLASDASPPLDAPESTGFSVEGPRSLVARRGASAALTLSVTPAPGSTGDFTVEVSGLPTDIAATVSDVTTEASISFDVAATGVPGEARATVRLSRGETVVEHVVTVIVPGDPGALDTGFGAGGSTELVDLRTIEVVEAQPDGRIVVAGPASMSDSAVRVARLLADGTRDPEWNGGESRQIEFGVGRTSCRVESMVVLADGRVLLQAVASTSVGSNVFLASLGADGRSDDTFAASGLSDRGTGDAAGMVLVGDRVAQQRTTYDSMTGFESTIEWISVVAPTRGRIEHIASLEGDAASLFADASGRVYSVGGATVTRLGSDGAVDTSFGSAGRASTSFGYEIRASSGAVLPDGTLFVGGGSSVVPGFEATAFTARLTESGSPIATYGASGYMRHDALVVGNGRYYADVYASADALFVLGPWAAWPSLVTSGGALDPGWSPGVSGTDAVAMRVTPDARIVVGATDGTGARVLRAWR